MHWGVRRYQPYPKGHVDGKEMGEAARRKEAIRQKRDDSKNRSILTNEQLKSKIARLQMEKQLRELTDSEVNAGRAYTNQILKDVGKRVITTAATGALLYAGKAAVSGEFNAKEFGNAIFNGGAKKK